MPALAAPAEETPLAGRAPGGSPELASFRAAFPGSEDTSSLDGLRASASASPPHRGSRLGPRSR